MSADKRGLKRVCVECGNRFYDLNKRPIICPSCSAEFSIEEKIKPRVVEKKAAPKKNPTKDEGQVTEATEATKDDDELEEEDDGVEVVSLDDLETIESTNNDDDGEVKIDLDDDDLDDLEVALDADSSPDASDDDEV